MRTKKLIKCFFVACIMVLSGINVTIKSDDTGNIINDVKSLHISSFINDALASEDPPGDKDCEWAWGFWCGGTSLLECGRVVIVTPNGSYIKICYYNL